MGKCTPELLLKNNNLKVTTQRVLILERIIHADTHFSANSLHNELSKSMDLVTIYRTLNIFHESKIIREIAVKDNMKFYELSCVHHPVHPHFLCTKCHKIFCLEALSDGDISILKKYAAGFAVDDISIQFTGICDKCK